MQDILTREHLFELLQEIDPPAVTIYASMARSGRETRLNSTRFKNGLQIVAQQLEAAGWKPREIERFLAEGQMLVSQEYYWQQQDAGLVVFIDRQATHTFRLPIPFEPLTVIGTTFHAKPLADYFNVNGRYDLLALSQNEVRFFSGTPAGLNQVDVKGMPDSMAEALRQDDPEARSSYHTADIRGSQADFFAHGHGDVDLDTDERLRRFLQQVDSSLAQVLDRDGKIPLLLAGVGEIQAIFRMVSGYGNLWPEGIQGNMEEWSPLQLHERSAALLENYWQRSQEAAEEALARARGRDNFVKGVEQLTRLALQGRIDTLFLPRQDQVWGQVDLATGQIEQNGGGPLETDDLYNVAALQTWAHGGSVYLQEEEDAEAAAILRV